MAGNRDAMRKVATNNAPRAFIDLAYRPGESARQPDSEENRPYFDNQKQNGHANQGIR